MGNALYDIYFKPHVHRFLGHIHRGIAWAAYRYGYSHEAGVYFLPFGLVLKRSDGTREEEVHAMAFARSLGLPVPRVISYGKRGRDRDGSILMTKMPGEILGNVWDDLGSVEREGIASQLRGYLAVMRNVKSPWGPRRICSVTGTAIRSVRVPMGLVGPCEDQEAFHDYLISTASTRQEGYDKATIESWFGTANKIREGLPHDIVFTHGDFVHHNILVHEGRVSAILDWEAAGWYPDYWEFTTAMRYQPEGSWWLDLAQRLSSPRDYSEELKSEKALWGLTSGSFYF